MLVANETVAQHLDDHDVPTLYRIHEKPDPLKVEEFEEFISTLGYSLAAPPNDVQPRHFQKLVEKIRGTPEEKPIAFLMLRTMQKARYDPENLGHFGLAAKSYTHFTSPIRRYPDLVVHRTLRESRQGRMSEDRREELTDDLPGDRAPHVRARAARRRRRARAGPVEEGPLHGGQGRRRVRGLRHRRHARSACSSSSSSTSSRAWCTSRRWRTTTTGSSSGRTSSAARTPARSTASATACGCRSSRSTWSGGRSISAWSEILDRVRRVGAATGVRAAARREPKSRAPREAPGKRKQRPGQARSGKRVRRSASAHAECRIGRCRTCARSSSARPVTSITARARWCVALTGTDPDRLKEEKARGITIDLGFAHLEADGVRTSRSWTCRGTSGS